jgi:hypothetical protein
MQSKLKSLVCSISLGSVISRTGAALLSETNFGTIGLEVVPFSMYITFQALLPFFKMYPGNHVV